MDGLAKVLIVDDNPLVCDMMQKRLDGEFVIEKALDYKQAQAKISGWSPDIIILDVELPDRNGYEICDELKQSTDTSSIPVIFHSGNDSLRERMLGYEVGAVDYLYKGCETDEIKAKLHAISRQTRQASALKEDKVKAEKTAIEAMTTSFELGKAIRYVEKSYLAGDFDVLSEMLLEFCRDMKLSAVIMFLSRSRPYFYSSTGSASPIERELVQKLHGDERFIDFGCRTLVNFSRVSLLVKNMPIENREDYGRLKDTLPFVLGATDAKVRMLDAEQAVTAQYASLTSSIEAAQLTLTTVKENFRRNLDITNSVMAELSSSLNLDIEKMNLDEADESHILDLVDSTSHKLSIILQENNDTNDILSNLVQLLENLTKEQNQIIVDTLTNTGEPESENDYKEDIELF